MTFSILHISDLHRDLKDEVTNEWLLDSLSNDFEKFEYSNPSLKRPSLCIVSGDLVYGIKPNSEDSESALLQQYEQAEAFLIGLADRFFENNRERVVILPGNHDICYEDVMKSVQKIEVPIEPEKKKELVRELFEPNSSLRWSWQEICFFRIINYYLYNNRFRHFAKMYERFYKGYRKYPIDPEKQIDIFDFDDLGFFIVALNSCFNNDPLRKAGKFQKNTITEACRALRDTKRAGWIASVAWHHNLAGGPSRDDYLESDFLQLFIESGATLGFHGHQHMSDCFDERYKLGPDSRKITLISASTLCADPNNLQPGIPRSYNIVELDKDNWKGVVHQRQMVNNLYNLPIWGPGHFILTDKSFFEFNLCKPVSSRPIFLDLQLQLEYAENLIGTHKWQEAYDSLLKIKEDPFARILITKALEGIGDGRLTISTLLPPHTNTEAVILGWAILNCGTSEEAANFIKLDFISKNEDASVREITQRVNQRFNKWMTE